MGGVLVSFVDIDIELKLDVFTVECHGFALVSMGMGLFLEDGCGVLLGGIFKCWEDFNL